MRTHVFDVTCVCGTVTEVVESYWPATLVDPADGEITPEECPKCGRGFDTDSRWDLCEPDPDLERDFDREAA